MKYIGTIFSIGCGVLSRISKAFVLGAAVHLLALVSIALAEDDADELSKQLANPIASLISVPFQNNFVYGAGPDGDGFSYTLKVQPVIPISITDDWNMISRTIVPISYNDYSPDGNVFGLGDTTQSLFFSPKAPTAAGLISFDQV